MQGEQKIAMRPQSSLLNLPDKNVLVEVATDMGLNEEIAVGAQEQYHHTQWQQYID